MAGTEYRAACFRHRATEAGHAAFCPPAVPCPHVWFVLREVLRSYVELHGLDELAPVSLAALLAAR